MTRIGGYEPPRQPRNAAMPRWLAFAIITVAFSVPIAILFLLVSPLLLQRTSLLVDDIEPISLMAAAGVIGAILAIRLHYRRATK